MDSTENNLLVTVRCLAYNHEPYIRQCLEGFVMQKTNFRFEAIVHDDASTDRTADIIREYAEKYPDIIKPIFETENQYSKRDGSLTRIMNAYTHGKYVAICEGDDYWIDPLKLQKQVDFLETHVEYSMCFHRCTEVFEGFERKKTFANLKSGDYTTLDILENWIVPTASVLYRKEQAPSILPVGIFFGDSFLFAFLAEKGRVYCLNDIMSVYRVNSGGVTANLSSISAIKRSLLHYETMKKVFPGKFDTLFNGKISLYNVQLFYRYRKTKFMWKYLFSFLSHPCFIWRTMRYIGTLNCIRNNSRK